MSKKIKGNKLPALTWNWLKVNYTDIDLQNTDKVPYTALKHRGRVDPTFRQSFLELDHGISEEVLQKNLDQCNLENNFYLGKEKMVFLDLAMSAENPLLVDQNQIIVPPLATSTLVLYNHCEEDVRVERNATIFARVANDAELNLVLIQRLNAKSSSNVSVMVEVGDGAKFNLATVELGAGNTVFHYMANLDGFASESHVQTAYLGSGKDHLDLFYHIHHFGEECTSNLQVNGALMDKAIKKFRGTIDFAQGCSGSNGNEEEFCVLLDDTVHSIAVPILLAGEDDIVGNHAASAGKIDDGQLFYLMSRGLSRKEAEGLIVEAKMTASLDQIPDLALRADLKQEIHERIINR